MRRPSFLLLAVALTLAVPALAQPGRNGAGMPASSISLAQDYARRGEHEKAVFLFGKLSPAEQVSVAVFPVYLESLQALKKHKDAEKLTKKALKLRPEDATLPVTLGAVYQAAGDAAAAEKQWQRVVAQLTPAQVLPVALEFSRRELPAWTEKTYLRGRALAKNDTEYAPQLIQLYTQTQNQPQVLAETLRLVAQDERQLPFVRNMLQNALREEKDFDALEKLLLSAVQDKPDQAAYSELLLWLQMQRHDFTGALDRKSVV